jgi:hypothetical protein
MDDSVLDLHMHSGTFTVVRCMNTNIQVDSFCQFFVQKSHIICKKQTGENKMTSETPVPQQPKKSKTWIFLAAGGALVLLCLCLAVAVFAVMPLMANVGQSTVTYEGNADEQLKADTLQLIAQYEKAQSGCDTVTLFIGNMMIRPEQTNDGSWSEMWQVNACEESHLYNITFTPDGVGGTYISASRIDQ